jgi:hypothetical protein
MAKWVADGFRHVCIDEQVALLDSFPVTKIRGDAQGGSCHLPTETLTPSLSTQLLDASLARAPGKVTLQGTQVPGDLALYCPGAKPGSAGS